MRGIGYEFKWKLKYGEHRMKYTYLESFVALNKNSCGGSTYCISASRLFCWTIPLYACLRDVAPVGRREFDFECAIMGMFPLGNPSL